VGAAASSPALRAPLRGKGPDPAAPTQPRASMPCKRQSDAYKILEIAMKNRLTGITSYEAWMAEPSPAIDDKKPVPLINRSSYPQSAP